YPVYNFTYWPFDWAKPLPQPYLDYLFYFLGFLAILIALGLFYRLAVLLFFVGFSYTFLLEQTRYLNHFYLICLLGFVFLFVDAHKSFSLGAFLQKKPWHGVVPKWQLWLMRFMIGIPYFWGGIAKINSDWLRGEPLGAWLKSRTDFPLIGQFFTEKWMVFLMSYGGMILDIMVIPLLLFKKTRPYAFVAACLFHLMNHELFTIGIFPWFMLFATTLFFSPQWPSKLFKRKGIVQENFMDYPANKWVVYSLGFWFLLHTFLPLRHWLYPGDVNWSEEGHRFSWHMKLRSKHARGFFRVVNLETGSEKIIQPEDILEEWQIKRMLGQPPLIWQFAQHLKSEFNSNGFKVAVHAHIEARVNNREYQEFVDPSVDLAAAQRPFFEHTNWIRPLKVPLRNRWAE
ncbi:MAG: HTTM domain-containing protein, partial [Luteibaculum sp.]